MLLSLSLGSSRSADSANIPLSGSTIIAGCRRSAVLAQLAGDDLYIALLVPALYVTGLGLALLVQRNTRFNGFVRTMLFVPQTVSLVVVALVWQVLLVDKIGLLNQFATWLHLGAIFVARRPALCALASSSSASGS